MDKKSLEAPNIVVQIIQFYQWERITDENNFQHTKCIQVGIVFFIYVHI